MIRRLQGEIDMEDAVNFVGNITYVFCNRKKKGCNVRVEGYPWTSENFHIKNNIKKFNTRNMKFKDEGLGEILMEILLNSNQEAFRDNKTFASSVLSWGEKRGNSYQPLPLSKNRNWHKMETVILDNNLLRSSLGGIKNTKNDFIIGTVSYGIEEKEYNDFIE